MNVDDYFKIDNIGEEQKKELENASTDNDAGAVDTPADEGGQGDVVIDDDAVNETQEPEEPVGNEDNGSEVNSFSEFGRAFAEENIFTNLTEDDLNGIKDPQSFIAAMDKEVRSRFTKAQRMVYDAMNVGADTSEAGQMARNIELIDSIDDATIEDESAKGEDWRRNLLNVYYSKLGLSEERARVLIERSFNEGHDIEDAKEARDSLKTAFQKDYDDMIVSQEKRKQEEEQKQKAFFTEAARRVHDTSNMFGINLSEDTRRNVFNFAFKSEQDPKTGEFDTPLSRYANENPIEFGIIVGSLYELTDGFKKLGNITSIVEKNAQTKGASRLANLLRQGSSNAGDGGLRFAQDTSGGTSDQDLLKNIEGKKVEFDF